MATRTEHDSMGPIEVAAEALWSAQTQRAMHFFGDAGSSGDRMPAKLIHSVARIKQAAAAANQTLGRLDADRSERIQAAAARVVAGEHDDQFLLPVWISGSGTQSNMNVNEVIASLAQQPAGGGKRKRESAPGAAVHPNDHVNASQSTNDVFPSAIHVATALELHGRVLPGVERMVTLLDAKAEAWADIVKVGRTHMMDAVPMTLGQEVSGWAHSLRGARDALKIALEELHALPLGGTAVGTGINTPSGYDARVCEELAIQTELPFRVAENKFSRMGGHEALLQAMGALKRLAVVLMRIADDVRLLGSGPRTGLGELGLPANEPGSSIMPGKVNPTQCEALSMRAVQVIGLEAAVTIACGAGFLQMNVYKPLIGANLLSAIELLTDGMHRFCEYCLVGTEPNTDNIAAHVSKVRVFLFCQAGVVLGWEGSRRLQLLCCRSLGSIWLERPSQIRSRCARLTGGRNLDTCRHSRLGDGTFAPRESRCRLVGGRGGIGRDDWAAWPLYFSDVRSCVFGLCSFSPTASALPLTLCRAPPVTPAPLARLHSTPTSLVPPLAPLQSLMLVTALNPVIGYDKAAAIAKHAHKHGSTLREAALSLGHLDAETFDRVIDARAMATPPAAK
jgi:fumarate hydratase class II